VELEGHIELVASWIDSVDIATAPARMVENQAHNADKETGGLTAASRRPAARSSGLLGMKVRTRSWLIS
jgi:hypothetical protein